MRDSLEIMRAQGGLPSEVRAIGGGARSRLWLQTLANVFGLPIATARPAGGAAYGAALLAAVGIGMFGSIDDAARTCIKPGTSVEPDASSVAQYDEMYDAYRQLYPRAAGQLRGACGHYGGAAAVIGVCGEALIDFTPMKGGSEQAYALRPGGSPYNVAIGLARLGKPAAYIGKISHDRFGDILREYLSQNGVDLRWLARAAANRARLLSSSPRRRERTISRFMATIRRIRTLPMSIFPTPCPTM